MKIEERAAQARLTKTPVYPDKNPLCERKTLQGVIFDNK